MDLLESTVNLERPELMVFAGIKVHKAPRDLMGILVSQESTELMVLEVKLAVPEHEESLETAERMEILVNPGFSDHLDQIMSPAKATVKVPFLVSKEFEVILVLEAKQGN